MINSILSHVKRVIELTNDEEIALCSIIITSQVRKKQFIIQPGFVCSNQTYVQSGALRSFILDKDGNEHTIQFAIEDWFISDFYSYITQQPATMFVEVIEKGAIEQISYTDVENLCLTYPKFDRFFRIVAQKAFAFSQKRILSNLSLTAEQRYLEFQKVYPSIVQKVPQYALASYLGITPEFLSKIRSNLSKS